MKFSSRLFNLIQVQSINQCYSIVQSYKLFFIASMKAAISKLSLLQVIKLRHKLSFLCY